MTGSRPASRQSSLGPRPTSRNSARGYRTVSRTANVDETLFGAANNTQLPGEKGNAVSIVGKDTVVRRRPSLGAKGGYPSRSARGPGDRDAACVIGVSELNRLRESARPLAKGEESARRAKQDEEQFERMEKAAARREKLLQMEEERKKKVQEAEAEKEGRSKQNPFLEKAQQLQAEQSDDVKHLNQLMQMSKVVTIRDAQMAEKAAMQAEKEDEEKHLDALMEIDRLKALKTYEVRERERLEQQRSGSKVIVEQIRDRQAQRQRDEEHRDQERAFVLKQIAALKEEEVEQAKQKQVAAKRLRDEVNAVNAAAMKIKEEKMFAERAEEEKIIEYIQNKERREKEEEERKLEAAAAKEKETTRLRGLQEKAQDKASEMDALRAKRAAQAAERTARDRERKEKERLEGIYKELHEARLRQQAEKEARMGDQAKAEREEFEQVVEAQHKQEQLEYQRKEDARVLRDKHSKALRAQIEVREEKAYQDRRDFLEHGSQMRAQETGERARLESLKTKKIEEMQKLGVPEKYLAKVRAKK